MLESRRRYGGLVVFICSWAYIAKLTPLRLRPHEVWGGGSEFGSQGAQLEFLRRKRPVFEEVATGVLPMWVHSLGVVVALSNICHTQSAPPAPIVPLLGSVRGLNAWVFNTKICVINAKGILHPNLVFFVPEVWEDYLDGFNGKSFFLEKDWHISELLNLQRCLWLARFWRYFSKITGAMGPGHHHGPRITSLAWNSPLSSSACFSLVVL